MGKEWGVQRTARGGGENQQGRVIQNVRRLLCVIFVLSWGPPAGSQVACEMVLVAYGDRPGQDEERFQQGILMDPMRSVVLRVCSLDRTMMRELLLVCSHVH